jgi:hypothetical protein
MKDKTLIPTNFIATVYGQLTPLKNSSFSKARCRIFYKGLNRNGSYISDEVAEQMIATLPGTPIIGNFDGDKDDFLGHNWDKEHSIPYGFVPEDMNFKWEMFLDPDGVYRTYACADLVLWTGRYPVASKIVGKSHSMELNPDTMEGEWTEENDEFIFKVTKAEFFGLCVLGDQYEPCFEGSCFYSHINKENNFALLKEELKTLFESYTNSDNSAEENLTGGQNMEEDNLNPQNPEMEEEVSNVETETVEEVETPEVEETAEEIETETEEVENEETTETESDEDKEEEENAEVPEETVEEIEETEDQKQIEILNSQLSEKDEEIAELKAELTSLKEYKVQKIKEEKETVLNTYANKFSEEELNEFKEKLESYESAIELKKDIALALLEKTSQEEEVDASQFTLSTSSEHLSGAELIIANYTNKKK